MTALRARLVDDEGAVLGVRYHAAVPCILYLSVKAGTQAHGVVAEIFANADLLFCKTVPVIENVFFVWMFQKFHDYFARLPGFFVTQSVGALYFGIYAEPGVEQALHFWVCSQFSRGSSGMPLKRRELRLP